VLNDPNYVLGPGADTRIAFAAFLELVLVVANIGTAVVLFPVVKRQNEIVALGYVASRIVESTIIAVGIFSLLSVVSLRQGAGAAAGAASLVAAGRALVAVHSWTFALGPALLAGLGNGLLLGYLMYTSGLVPRRMALLGLVGGPLVMASALAVLFGLFTQVSPVSAVLTIPEFLWELSLGIYLVVKGFRPSPVTEGPAAEGGRIFTGGRPSYG
jgi:hypothetical protein